MTMFAKWFFGFSPEHLPIITFSLAGNRDRLLRMKQPGDVIVFVGTQGEETSVEHRGMLLGAAEIGNKNVKSEEVADLSLAPESHFENGRYKWPEAIPMLCAWRFEPLRRWREVLRDGLTGDARVRAVRLSERDEAAVRALTWVEVTLPETSERDRQRLLSRAFEARPTPPGPIAGPGNHIVIRTPPTLAWTYAMRFGKSNIWKIGRAADLNGRLSEVNAHVPFELLDGQMWSIALRHSWPTQEDAQAMEQRVLRRLADRRTHGERVQCSMNELQDVWVAAILG